MIGTVIILSVLFVLVLIHEAGHLVVAKMCNVKVNTYSIGFGPRIIGVKFHKGKRSYKILNSKATNLSVWACGETEYRLSPFLLGGFCAMEGEIEGGDNDRALANKPYLQKVMVAFAGAFANIITGFTAIYLLLIPKSGLVEGLKITVTSCVSLVGEWFIQMGALITGQVPMSSWQEISSASASMSSFNGIVLQFGAYSLILAIFNLLPIPALDGSLPFLWALDNVFGKEKGQKIANMLAHIGFVLLMSLQVVIVIYWIFF